LCSGTRERSISTLRTFRIDVAALAMAVASSAACVNGPDTETLSEGVFLGTSEPNHLFPWVVDLGSGCRGSLVSPGWVLTAAHSVVNLTWDGRIHHRRRRPDGVDVVQSRAINVNTDVVHHPAYQASPALHDIALLRIRSPFVLSEVVQPAHLPFARPPAGRTGVVVSSIFHHVSGPPPAGQFAVFRAPLPAFDPFLDQAGKFLTRSPDASICEGDSGSGFVTDEGGRLTAAGIVSERSLCVPANELGAFADVAATGHLEWIRSVYQHDRSPDTSLSNLPTMCYTAPARHEARTPHKRADAMEIWAENAPMPLSFALHPSGGTSFGIFEDWSRHESGFVPDSRWVVGDVDLDGDQDVMAIWNQDGTTTVTVRRSELTQLVMEQ
jgi:hypothetical protein